MIPFPRRLVAAVLTLLMALTTPAAVLAQQAVTPSERVTRNVVVRQAPTAASLPLDRLLPGAILPLIADGPDWYRVRLPDGQDGFVSKAWTDLSGAALVAGGKTFKVHVIDVGTGLAVFVEGADFALLYDAGSQDDLTGGADNRVVAYIKAVRPDLQVLNHVILSHPHKDHLELMPGVFDAFQVLNVWDSGRVNSTAGYCKFLRKVVAEGAVYHDAIASNAVRTATFKDKTCPAACS
jgi:beta-lactamase superfamily II metal-dependent hydrolase